MEANDVADRAGQRELVRRGYDAISVAYRSDDGAGHGLILARAAGRAPGGGASGRDADGN